MLRQVIPTRERFFNDGAWYVLSSTSLGNSGFNPEQMVRQLRGDPSAIERLLEQGICLPLFFPGDCALDRAVIIVGDLTEEEDREWLGRISSQLHIPCGEFLLLGGGGSEEDWERAIANVEPDPHLVNFQKFQVTPGDYLVEVYAFLGSMTFNFALEDIKKRNWRNWLRLDQIPPAEQPEWANFLMDNDYIDSERFDLQEYVIRLSPLYEPPAKPVLDEDFFWCSQYSLRRPEHCPKGIRRSRLCAQIP